MTPDQPTPDQHAEKVRAGIAVQANDDERAEAHTNLAALLALAKQGEAFDRALAHATSLYGHHDPTTAELAEQIREAAEKIPVGEDDRWGERRRDEILAALSELVIRASGHVPVEAFAAAMADRDRALVRANDYKADAEQAEKERDEAVKARDAMLAMMQAEPPPPQIVDEITRQTIGDLAADRDRLADQLKECDRLLDMQAAAQIEMRRERDRLAAALKAIIHYGEREAKTFAETGRIAREALAQACQEQTP